MGKRKREADSGSKLTKKVVIDAPPSSIRITSISKPTQPPVIATTPGIQVQSSATFKAIPTTGTLGTRKDNGLVLKSTSHPKLDYTAREEGQSSSEPRLKHYLGLYDPKTGEIELIEAKKMVIRATIREDETMADEPTDVKHSMMELKTELGQTFGTRKAKKVIQETVLNAIAAPKKPGEQSSPAKLTKAAKAMLESVGDITSTMATREELQAVVNEAKPVPKANLDAEDIADVYDPIEIIGGDILNLVPVREWQEKAKHGEAILSASRFVAHRVRNIALNDDAVMRLRVLRYMYFVMQFYLSATSDKGKGAMKIPSREKLKEALAPAPEAVIENIRRKFSEGGLMRKSRIDLLMTHCCVFAAIVDDFVVNTQHLKTDLKLDQKQMNSYFHEIGAKTTQASKQNGGHTVARLAHPLEFPTQRRIVPRKK